MPLPYILVLFRFLLAPTIFWIAYATPESVARLAIVIAIVVGLLSDTFDGIVARHRGISTVKIRRLDGQTDLVFWFSVGVACYWLSPALITAYHYQIITLFIIETLCCGLSFLCSGKETCIHTFLSKIWGLTLLIAFVSLIGFRYGGFPLQLAIYWELLPQTDVILIILLLPRWQDDIPSTYHAYFIRKGKTIRENRWLNS